MSQCSLLAAGLLFLAVGCGRPKERWPDGVVVQGSVTIDGEPVSSGRICVICPNLGATDSIQVAADGSFKFATRLPEGEYVAWLDGGPPPLPGEEVKPWAYASRVPRKYQSESTSPLRLGVKKGVSGFPMAIDSSKAGTAR